MFSHRLRLLPIHWPPLSLYRRCQMSVSNIRVVRRQRLQPVELPIDSYWNLKTVEANAMMVVVVKTPVTKVEASMMVAPKMVTKIVVAMSVLRLFSHCSAKCLECTTAIFLVASRSSGKYLEYTTAIFLVASHWICSKPARNKFN